MKAGGAVGVANDIEAVQEQNDFSDSANSRYAENNESMQRLSDKKSDVQVIDGVGGARRPARSTNEAITKIARGMQRQQSPAFLVSLRFLQGHHRIPLHKGHLFLLRLLEPRKGEIQMDHYSTLNKQRGSKKRVSTVCNSSS